MSSERLTDAQVKHMVDRFLCWRLPENFHPDNGISFKPTFNDHLPTPTRCNPVGTNLLGAGQATEMVRHMVEGLPSEAPPTRGGREAVALAIAETVLPADVRKRRPELRCVANILTDGVINAIADAILRLSSPTEVRMREALEALDAVLDFSVPGSEDKPWCFDDWTEVNAAFAKARLALGAG